MAKSRPKYNPQLKVEDAVKALSYLIGVTGVLSAVRQTDLIYSLSFFSLCIVSVIFEYWHKFLIPRRLLTLATLLLLVLSFIRMSLQNFVQPSIEALMILLAIKFLEEKQFRDYMQIYVLSIFLLAGSALLSLDIIFLVYFFVLLFLLAAAMVLLAYYSEDHEMKLPFDKTRDIVLKSLFIPLAAIPLAVILFVLLPRTSFPVFNILERGGGVSTGFSDTVGLGKFSSMQEDSTVIMRVKMERVDDSLLYWRGIVLDYFDGDSWKSTGHGQAGRAYPTSTQGLRIAQTVYLDPYGNRYIFALDKPLSIHLLGVSKFSDLTYSVKDTIIRKLKYDAISVLSDTLSEDDIDLSVYLQLPKAGTEKIRELTKAVAISGSMEDNATAIFHYLRDGVYKYSLNNLPSSSAPLNEFLFRNKYGNCEYFASAMAVMLRLSGIPARLVGGYRGGFYNQAGGYYMIPQQNAHVWVEAYFKNRGWVRLDPTPVVQDDYVSSSRKGLLFMLRFFFDTIDYYWSAAVINYDIEKQFATFSKFREGFRIVHFEEYGSRAELNLLIGILGIGLLLLVLNLLRRAPKSLEEKLLASFLNKIKRRGYIKTKSQGLEEFVDQVKEAGLRECARDFVEQFEGFFYRDRRLTKEEVHRLRRMLSKL